MLRSLRRNWPVDLPVLLLHYDLCLSSIKRLTKSGDVRPVQVNPMNGPAIGRRRGLSGAAPHLKLHLWSERFNEFENLIYLDSDLVVLAPLDRLISANQFTIIEAPNPMSSMFVEPHDNRLRLLLAEDGLNVNAPMANSGVMVLPPQWRSNDHYRRLCNLVERYEPYSSLAEQTVINIWMQENGLAPSPDRRFNYTIGKLHEIKNPSELNEVAIIHNAGGVPSSIYRKAKMLLLSLLANKLINHAQFLVLQTWLKSFRDTTCKDLKNLFRRMQ